MAGNYKPYFYFNPVRISGHAIIAQAVLVRIERAVNARYER
jgi:hypothetical protein